MRIAFVSDSREMLPEALIPLGLQQTIVGADRLYEVVSEVVG